MSTGKHIDRICLAVCALALVLTLLFMSGASLGLTAAAPAMGYEERLFDTGRVHTLDIVMDDWEGFIEGCEDEEYALCSLVIDGEACRNVAIRAKGNTSLSSVSSMGSSRYSFKIEFDHYDSAHTYYGLDKLSLNNLIQDNTMMKDWLVYRLMGGFGADAPLCSYVYLTVNGKDWGLYLAVEGVEDSFLQRNYGTDSGELYKPDSMSIGGGRGNGKDFDMDAFDPAEGNAGTPPRGGFGGDRGGMGSTDVKLQYTDDDPDSYPNIFDSAKTELTAADKARLIAALKALGEGHAQSAVEVDEVLRYFVVHNFAVNDDSYTGSMIHNYYLYEKDGRLSMIPWDYNLAFGTFQSGNASSAVNRSVDYGSTLTDRPMVYWIFRDGTYTELYHQYYREFADTLLAEGRLTALIDSTAQMIAPYVERDPTRFCTYEDFETGVAALRQFCLLRTESVTAQLAGDTTPVDTGTLDLSDMGTMGMGGGNRGEQPGGQFPGGGQMPEGGRFPGGQMPEGGQFPGGQMPGGGQFPGGQMPGRP